MSGYSRLADDAWVRGWLTLWQRVNMFHAANDLAPDRILTVKEGRIIKADEELAVGRVRIIGPRHGAYAAHMRFSVEFLRQIWLGRTAHARAVRATALRHESRNHAVELHTVIKAFASQFCDTGDMVYLPSCN